MHSAAEQADIRPRYIII